MLGLQIFKPATDVCLLCSLRGALISNEEAASLPKPAALRLQHLKKQCVARGRLAAQVLLRLGVNKW